MSRTFQLDYKFTPISTTQHDFSSLLFDFPLPGLQIYFEQFSLKLKHLFNNNYNKDKNNKLYPIEDCFECKFKWTPFYAVNNF